MSVLIYLFIFPFYYNVHIFTVNTVNKKYRYPYMVGVMILKNIKFCRRRV